MLSLDLDTKELVIYVRNLRAVVKSNNLNKAVAFLLGKVLGYCAPLALQKPDDMLTYYGETIRPMVDKIIDDIMQQTPIDYTLVSDATFQVWRLRMALAFDPLITCDERLADAMFAATIPGQFSSDFRQFFVDNFQENVDVAAAIESLVTALKQKAVTAAQA